ncbi:MAG: flagellar biosynthetic protein FliR [Isosphaeraceae bacterium]
MNADPVAWGLAHAGLVALVLARTGGLVWTAPVLGANGPGSRMKFLLVVGLTLTVAPTVAASEVSVPALAGVAFGWALLVEALVGAALGWSAALVIAGARQAGEVVAAQAGLSSATLFDPDSGEEVSALGHLYGLMALGVFLALDGPLTLVKALAESYQVVAPGAGPDDLVKFAFGRVGDALELALRASAPVALALVMAGLALGLIGRAAPSLQRAALLMPIRTVLGFVLILLGLATLAATLAQAWGDWPGPVFNALAGSGEV